MRLSRAVRDTLVGALIAAGALASVVLFVTTTYFTVLCLIGIGFLALPHLTTAVRWVCDLNRRAAARSGVPVERPYRPEPEEIERDIVGWVRRCKWILADPASWRDLLWLLLNSVVGLLLGSAPAALLYYAGEGLVLAAGLWRPVAADGTGRWYAFITVDSWPAALAAALAALAVFAGWLHLSSWILKGHAYFVLFLLGPTQGARLASRVRHLAETRSGALDIQAAEVRRIERDLHDGAQARLVSLGLTLGAVDRQLDRNTEEARRLLNDARSSSVQALRELRGLVRGIHPRCSPNADSPTPYGPWASPVRCPSPSSRTCPENCPTRWSRPSTSRCRNCSPTPSSTPTPDRSRCLSTTRTASCTGRSPTTAGAAPRCRPGAAWRGSGGGWHPLTASWRSTVPGADRPS